MNRITTLGLALGTAIAFASAAQADIKMAVTGPLTGPNAAFGAQLKNGVEQAVEDINAAGGILGQKIVLSYGDDVSEDRKSTRLNSSHANISYAVFCLKKKNKRADSRICQDNKPRRNSCISEPHYF